MSYEPFRTKLAKRVIFNWVSQWSLECYKGVLESICKVMVFVDV